LREQALLLARGELETAEAVGIALDAARRLGNPPQLWKTHIYRTRRRPRPSGGASL